MFTGLNYNAAKDSHVVNVFCVDKLALPDTEVLSGPSLRTENVEPAVKYSMYLSNGQIDIVSVDNPAKTVFCLAKPAALETGTYCQCWST